MGQAAAGGAELSLRAFDRAGQTHADLITLLVMPSVVAVHDGLDGEFMLLDFREAQSVACVEFQDGAVYVQDRDRVEKYDFRRKRMCSRAAPAAQAIKDRLDRLAA
jgi:Domain of unknown function (DUF5753)